MGYFPRGSGVIIPPHLGENVIFFKIRGFHPVTFNGNEKTHREIIYVVSHKKSLNPKKMLNFYSSIVICKVHLFISFTQGAILLFIYSTDNKIY